MSYIAVIDYGMGNLHSVCKALTHVAPEKDIRLINNASGIRAADRILLPGQGSIRGCMDNIFTLDIADALLQAAREKPFLGICIGPQLMSHHSTENGGVNGLGILNYEVISFTENLYEQGEIIKIPHMGWNTIRQTVSHPLWHGIPDNSYFYYVHSYHLTNTEDTIGETTYGLSFPAAVVHENIAGLQAHPEKSSHAGLQFLANFIDWDI